MKNIKKKIKKKIYKSIRFLIIKDYTRYLGKIEEQDDKIICYVNNKKLRKYKEYPYYDIYFMHLLDKEVLNNLKLNKPIYYVIENMIFDRMLKFSSVPNTYIKFKNCTFTDAIKIYNAGNVVFEDNKYFNNRYVYAFNKYFLEGTVENLEFINEDFVDLEEKKKTSCFGIDVKTKNLKIINTQINANEENGMIAFEVKENLIIEDSEVFAPIIDIDAKNIEIVQDSRLNAEIGTNIKASNLKIDNSKIGVCLNEDIIDLKVKDNLTLSDSEIFGSIIELDSKNIEMNYSMLTGVDKINIQNENKNEIEHINSPLVVYNGFFMFGVDDISKEKIGLQVSRKELISKLGELKNSCNTVNSHIINNVTNNLNQQSVSRVLKIAKK